MDKILVAILGLGSIGFVAWFFFGKKEKAVKASGSIDIKVSGGYDPSVIVLQKGKKATLHFLRTDPSDCLEEVVIPDFKIRKTLTLNEKTEVEINPQKAGEFDFSCGMGMYHGKIIVK